MDLRIEEVSPVEKKLIVEVPWTTVATKLGDAYRDLARGVQLKGFRKGKVPRSVLERMFGKRVRAEVANQLVRESFVSATTDHKLEAVSEPRVENDPSIKKGEAFSFEATVEVKGEVKAKDYFGMSLTTKPISVEDEEIEQGLTALRREHTELLPVEDRDITSRMDVISIAIKGTVAKETIDRPNVSVDLGEPTSSPIPGLVESLIGLPCDTKDHLLEFEIPSDGVNPEVAGANAALTVSILDVRQKHVPELDDEFAKDTGRGQSVDELKQAIREEITTQKQEAAKQELRNAALKQLCTKNPIPIASSLIERAIEMQFQRFQMMLGAGAGDATKQGITDEVRDSLRPSATDRVRGQLLLDSVARIENIEVSDEEIDTYVATQAKQRGMNPGRLRADFDRHGRLEDIRYQLREDKVLDLLVERAEIREEDISPQEGSPDEEASNAPETPPEPEK